ncbi:DUF72 domain-containing protein [Rhodocytophaga rosea]|uniref:DUF72 domain-containing protein n=1 Tax=Rhodocytophaga rosea TaxID=2704465 RepID=A0A6C0GV02_9BACT|nr:DUF72 domain-containing protein [Rhodocytophaga rosea]
MTHKLKFVNIDQPLDKFMFTYELMGNRLGPILIQIASSFHFDKQVTEAFFAVLRKKYPTPIFALEARHKSWFVKETIELMQQYQISFVISSAGKRFPGHEIATTETVYFRLHGEEKLYSSPYSDEKLEKYAFMIKDWLLDRKQIWVLFNNTILGHAITDSKKLYRLIQRL